MNNIKLDDFKLDFDSKVEHNNQIDEAAELDTLTITKTVKTVVTKVTCRNGCTTVCTSYCTPFCG